MSGRDASQLAADITDAFVDGDQGRKARSALDELVGLVGTLEQAHDDLLTRWTEQLNRAVAAEAALATVTEDRDRLARALDLGTINELRRSWHERDNAEAGLAEANERIDVLTGEVVEWKIEAERGRDAISACATTRQALGLLRVHITGESLMSDARPGNLLSIIDGALAETQEKP